MLPHAPETGSAAPSSQSTFLPNVPLQRRHRHRRLRPPANPVSTGMEPPCNTSPRLTCVIRELGPVTNNDVETRRTNLAHAQKAQTWRTNLSKAVLSAKRKCASNARTACKSSLSGSRRNAACCLADFLFRVIIYERSLTFVSLRSRPGKSAAALPVQSESCSAAYSTIASSSDAENRASFRDTLPVVRRAVGSESFRVSFRFGGVRGPFRPDRGPSRGSARSRGVRSRSRFVGERPSASDPSPWSTAARERFVVDVRGASAAVIP